MIWLSIVVASSLAAEPCPAPRIHDPAPLAGAMAQDRALAQQFFKAATACTTPGEACTQARLECNTLLTATLQRQASFDEGIWLRDMLLPYEGQTYAMTRTIGPQTVAPDSTCNVDVETLKGAAERRTVQASRRDGLFQEYGGYSKWAQQQQQACREKVSAVDAKTASDKAEAERVAAVTAAAAAAEALKLKQAQEAQKLKEAEAAAETQRQKDALAAEERRQKDLAAAEEKRQQQAQTLAQQEAERQERQQREREQKQEEKEREQARLQAERDEANRVKERDTGVASARAEKARLIRDAETKLARAREEEALKKQAALDAVNSSPAIASAAVAEAGDAEKARVQAEKDLADAKMKSDAIEIDDSHEREYGSVFLTGGVSGADTGLSLGVLAGAHFGFWQTAPSDGMASGFELRLWARYGGSIAPTGARLVDSLVTARYFLGRFGFGAAGELRWSDPSVSQALRGGAGPAVAVAIVDNPNTRVLLGVNYLPLGNVIDPTRVMGDLEISYRFVTLQVNGGTLTEATSPGGSALRWSIGAYLGVRAHW